jgi:hypothetical protein
MEGIAKLLKTKVTEINRDKGNYEEKAFQVRTDTIESKIQIFDYLGKYPLFGYKYYSQINLDKIHKLILNKEHKTVEGRNKLIEYSNLMKYDENKHT